MGTNFYLVKKGFYSEEEYMEHEETIHLGKRTSMGKGNLGFYTLASRELMDLAIKNLPEDFIIIDEYLRKYSPEKFLKMLADCFLRSAYKLDEFFGGEFS